MLCAADKWGNNGIDDVASAAGPRKLLQVVSIHNACMNRSLFTSDWL